MIENPSRFTTIRISKELKERIRKLCEKGQTYEEVISELLKSKEDLKTSE